MSEKKNIKKERRRSKKKKKKKKKLRKKKKTLKSRKWISLHGLTYYFDLIFVL